MTSEKAYEFVRKKALPYWKLYRGSEKVSQCDVEENPEASAEIALNLFREELESRPAATYKINVYRNHKGESGGFKFDFTINPTETMYGATAPINVEQIREQIRNEMEIKNSLASLHEKVNAIGEFLYSKYNEDEKDDFSGIEKLAKAFNAFRGLSPQPNAFDVSAKPLERGVSQGFFS